MNETPKMVHFDAPLSESGTRLLAAHDRMVARLQEEGAPPEDQKRQERTEPPIAPNGIEKLRAIIASQGAESLIRLKMNDHYVEVVTDNGREFIYMRFADAIEVVEFLPGLLVHRSHWVVLSKVVSAKRRGRTIAIKMSNGEKIPASRRRMQDLRRVGIL